MIEGIRRYLRSENIALFSRSIIIQIVGYGISLALTPLSIAFYTPADFGLFAIVLTVATLVGSYGGMRLEWAVINEHSNRIAELLMRFSHTLLIAWGLITIVACLLMPNSVYLYLNVDRNIMLFATPIAVVTGLGIFQQSWGIRLKSYQEVYLSRNATLVSRQAIQIAMGFISPSAFSLLLSEFLSRLIGLQVFRQRVGHRIGLLLPRRFTRLLSPVLFHRYGHYSRVALPSSLLDFLMNQGLSVIIVPLYGIEAAGAYWLVQRIFGIPISLIGTVVGDVFQGQVARQTDHRVALREMTQVAVLLTAFSFVVMPAAAVAFWLFTQYFYDGKWLLSGQIGLYVVPGICIQFIASPLSRIFVVHEQMQYKFIFDGVLLVFLGGWILATKVGNLDILQSALYLTAAQSAAYGLYIVLAFYVARRKLAPT